MINQAFAAEKTVTTIINPQNMLESISKSFVDRSNYIMETPLLWLIFIGVFLAIILLYFLAKKSSTVAFFTVQNGSFTKKLLQYALEHKSVFDIQIDTTSKYPSIEMQIIKCTEKLIVLRSIKKDVLMNVLNLENISIRCTLLNTSKANQGYYIFNTKIAKEKRVDDYLELALYFPAKVEKLQRREHLRIEPKHEYILGLALWSEQYSGNTFVNKPELWGKPLYSFVPGKVNQIRLTNISASGAKMIIAIHAHSTKLNLEKKVLLLLDIWDPEIQQKIRYWIRCTEQNAFKISDKNAVEIGIKFKEWTTTPLHDESLHFVPVSKDREIPPLANWIMKRYLEQFREESVLENPLS